MFRKFDLLRTLTTFFFIDKPENEHANVEEEIRQLRTERDNFKERCEILAKQLEEAQVVRDSRKQPTTTFQDKATPTRQSWCKGKRRY